MARYHYISPLGVSTTLDVQFMSGRSSTSNAAPGDLPEGPTPGPSPVVVPGLKANPEGESVRKPPADAAPPPTPEPERERPPKEAAPPAPPAETIVAAEDVQQIPIPIARLIPKLRK